MVMFTVLIVEDNLLFRNTIRETLRSHFPDLLLCEAGNGKEALQKVDAWRPHIIFLDIKLPVENGLELTKKIRKKYPESIIVILTSYDLPEYRYAAQLFGADHFLSKESFSQEEIVSLLKTCLSSLGNKSKYSHSSDFAENEPKPSI